MSMREIAGVGSMLYNSGGWTVMNAGPIVAVSVRVHTGSGSWDSVKCPYVIPDELRPTATINAPVATANGASVTGALFANTDGTITVANQGGSGSDGLRIGALCYVATSG